MISSEQKELAGYIKGVHLSLRCRSQEVGAEKAWEEHLKKDDVLKMYSKNMKKLSENFWEVNCDKNDMPSRIRWMVEYVQHYFHKNGLIGEQEKELRKVKHFKEKNDVPFTSNILIDISFSEPYKLLDVGSCFNPFKEFEFLDVFPIDLCPATNDVKKCNFLEVLVQGQHDSSTLRAPQINIMPENFFDVVVFSLFLEYLPLPILRFQCAKKAYDLLKPNGLLLIATSDSKHASANAKIMKKWKIALSCIGFVQIKIEKLKYLYCMAYRKCLHKEYPVLLYKLMNSVDKPHEYMIIPQDMVDYGLLIKKNVSEGEIPVPSISGLNDFDELPFCHENE